jgi:hypothetical protein
MEGEHGSLILRPFGEVGVNKEQPIRLTKLKKDWRVKAPASSED